MNEDLLHGYVDDALAPDERRIVEAHLAANPQDAARVQAWRAQNETLRRLYAPVLDEPHALAVGAARRAPAANAPRFARLAGALAATLLLGISVGYVGHGWIGATEAVRLAATPIARQAALAHVAYVPEVRHPVEVGAQEQQHLVAWLSKRLAAPIKAPVLGEVGYQLLGGRLLPAAGEIGDAPVALLMYENGQGKRLSLMVRRAVDNSDTAFRFSEQGGTGVFYWIDGPFGYALAGDIPRDELATVARLVYRQLNP